MHTNLRGKKRAYCLAAILLLPLFCACTADNAGNRLADRLFENYRAEVEFIFSGESGELAGEANITKGARTVLSFASPELLAGVTAESDESGAADTITFHYYGMRVPLPSGSLSKINALLSLFSDHAATAVVGLSREEFCDLSDASGDPPEEGAVSPQKQKACTVALPNDVNAEIVFDPIDGKPRKVTLKSGENTIRIRVKNWQPIKAEADGDNSETEAESESSA